MHLTRKAIEERVKDIDVFIELLDARLPASSAWRNSRSLSTPVVSSSAQRSQAWRTWPWISLSPTTIESRLDATRNRWPTARSSCRA